MQPFKFVRGNSEKLKVAVIFAVLLLVCGFLALFLLQRIPSLSIYDEHGRLLKKMPLPDGEFVHHYIHSIHKTPVDEVFIVKSSDLILTQVKYDSYGVGMPTDEGEGFTLQDGRFLVNLQRTFKQIDVRVSPVPDHGIIIGDILYRFTDWTGVEDLLMLKPSVSYSIHFGRNSLP